MVLRKSITSAFVMLTLLLITACSGCATSHQGMWWTDGDPNTSYDQAVAKTATEIHLKLSLDTKQLHTEGYVREDVTDMEGSGSGNVVAKKDGHSLVMTAAHVCHNDEMIDISGFVLKILSRTIVIETTDGRMLLATVVYSDTDADVCFLDAVGDAGNVASLSSEIPPIGGKIVYAGAPAGLWGKGLVPIFVGIYAGLVPESEDEIAPGYMMFTIPVTGGSSGSGAFYRGKLIGMITATHREFREIGYAVKGSILIKHLKLAKAVWKTL